MVERGHYVESWCPSTADQNYLPLGEIIDEHIVPFEWQPKAKHAFGKEALKSQNLISKLRSMEMSCRIAAEQISKQDFDLLFANACIFFRTSPIGRFVALPKLLYLQEPFRWLYEALPRLPWIAYPPPRRYWWSPRYLKPFIKDWIEVQASRVQAREELTNAKSFDRILVNSYFSRESILRSYGLDAHVCYLGINSDRFIYQRKPREDFILCVGAFTPEKNVEFIIKSIALLRDPKMRLIWIANSIPSRWFYENMLAVARTVEVELEVFENVTDEELIDFYNRASLMVYAPRLEPFGLVPLEANACGLPVVSVPEGGLRETIKNGINGIVVNHEPNSVSHAIQKLLDEKEYLFSLRKSCINYVKEFWCFEKAIDRLEEQFTLTIQKKKSQEILQ